MTISVFLADDDAGFRGAYKKLFDRTEGFRVAGEAADGVEAVRLITALKPAVALLDVQMPGLTGLAAAARIVATGRTRVIMLTTFDLDHYVYAALSLGASGFLLKDVTPEHLVAAVRLVRSGDALLAPSITRRLVERFAARSPVQKTLHRDLTGLTARELEVLGLLGRGLSNTELAGRLNLAEATVKTHVARILGKLHLRDRAQAVVAAYETGLIAPGEG